MVPPFCTTLIASIIPSRRLPLESVHDFRVSAAEAACVSSPLSVRPDRCDDPRSVWVLSSSFFVDASSRWALSLSSASLFFPVKLMMAKTSAPTKSTAATTNRTSQIPRPLFFWGAQRRAAERSTADRTADPAVVQAGARGAGPAASYSWTCSFIRAFLPCGARGVSQGAMASERDVDRRVRCGAAGRTRSDGPQRSDRTARRRHAFPTPAELAPRAADEQSARRARRPRVALARADPRVGAADDDHRRGDRRTARCLPRRERALGLVCPRRRWVGARARREQPDERPLRPRGRDRLRQLPARALRPAPGAVGDDQPSRAVDGRVGRQHRRPRDPRRAVLVPRLADGGLRPGRVPALGRVHRTAPPAEEARSPRADGPRRVGTVARRGALRRRRRALADRDRRGVAGVRAAVHRGADGQAHRQDPMGCSRWNAHAAGAARRGQGTRAHKGDDGLLLRPRRPARRHGHVPDPSTDRPPRPPEAGRGVGAVLAAEAGRAAGGLPDLAAVVRGAGVRPYATGRWTPRARPDPGCHPRLVSAANVNWTSGGTMLESTM